MSRVPTCTSRRGAIHTLHVPATNKEVTDVWFAIRGANLNLDANGNVEAVIDAATVLEIYRGQCRALGLAAPKVIGELGECVFRVL